MTDTVLLPIVEVHQRVEAIFNKAGLSSVQSGPVTGMIVAAERDAAKSHGIYRIEGVLRTIKAGKVTLDASPTVLPGPASGIVTVSGGGGFANPAFELGLTALADGAGSCGVAALVINDVVHFSALWAEVEALTERGLAALAMCPSYAAVAPTGGNKPLLGTNPIALRWPRDVKPPYVFDFRHVSFGARGNRALPPRRQIPS
jgi:delta1-piperideine-2-carboxylate reductase